MVEMRMQGSKGSKQVTQAKQLNVAINGFGRIGEPLLLPPACTVQSLVSEIARMRARMPLAHYTEPGVRDIGNLCMYAFSVKCISAQIMPELNRRPGMQAATS